MTKVDGEIQAPGWDAIAASLRAIYPDQTPQHFETPIKYRMGGPDPIDGFDVYRVDEPSPHWHYVTYGFSELYEKKSEDLAVSGLGFELTFRLRRTPDQDAPPKWVFGLIQNLARYTFSTGNAFDEGHNINLNGPILPPPEKGSAPEDTQDAGEVTALEALAMVRDPVFEDLETCHGRVKFLQMIGITMDEHDLMQAWSSERFLAVLSEGNPFLITDIRRPSLLEDCALAERIGQQMKTEGSTQESFYAPFVEWEVAGENAEVARIRIGANAIGSLRLMLLGRTLHHRPFHLMGPEAVIDVLSADEAGWDVADGKLQLRLTAMLAEEIEANILPKRGEYTWESLPGLTIEVVPSEIRDTAGKEVIRVIG